MKKTSDPKRKLRLYIIAAVVAVVAVFLYFSLTAGAGEVTNKISVAQAQEIIDETFGSIAKSTAKGAQTILKNSKIKAESVSYGDNKDVIVSCAYETVDAAGVIADHADEIMTQVYTFYQENEESGKKTNATKVNLQVTAAIQGYLADAKPLTGKISLTIYETEAGMQLYLEDSLVDTCTGGLITVTKAIREITTVEYQGQQIDITNKNTLRTGVADCIALENYSSQRPDTGNAIQRAWNEFKDSFHKNFIEKDRYEYLLKGLGTTLSITLFAALLGIFLGFLIAVVRCTNQMTGKLGFLDGICRLYLTVMRGTPVMVQLIILYFVCLLPLNVDKFIAAVICFGLNSGAYVAEIVRGGIMSVDKGQIEAGRSLGFNYVKTMVYFVVPQAFKAILPSLANEFITLLKESSVAFYIGVADLTQGGLKIRSVTYSNFMPLIAVAVIYLALVMILTKLVSILERRLAKSDH